MKRINTYNLLMGRNISLVVGNGCVKPGDVTMAVHPEGKGEFVKRTDYTELLERFQANCRHDFGTLHSSEGTFCSCCYHDLSVCQHRNEHGKFCSQCGAKNA